MNIGQTVYLEVVKRAERGARVVRVELPEALYNDWVEEGHNINSLFSKLGVKVVRSEVTSPLFIDAGGDK